MAAFYLDESVALAVESELRVRGHFVTSTYAEGRGGAPDPLVRLEAADRNWTLVTPNRHDFRLLHDAWLCCAQGWGSRRRHAGILVLDQVRGQTAIGTARLIDAVVRDPDTQLPRSLYDWRIRIGSGSPAHDAGRRGQRDADHIARAMRFTAPSSTHR